MTSACDTLKLILKLFGSVIRSNIQSPVGSFGVDIPREERYQKSVKCYEYLNKIRSLVVKKQSLPGGIGSSLREVHTLMQSQLDWRPPKMSLLKFKNASVWWRGWWMSTKVGKIWAVFNNKINKFFNLNWEALRRSIECDGWNSPLGFEGFTHVFKGTATD